MVNNITSKSVSKLVLEFPNATAAVSCFLISVHRMLIDGLYCTLCTVGYTLQLFRGKCNASALHSVYSNLSGQRTTVLYCR